MFKLSIFATVALFWATLSASLMQLELASSPVRRMKVPTYRSMLIRSTDIMQVNKAVVATYYK